MNLIAQSFTINYFYNDNYVNKGIIYYRLKQVDFDGNYKMYGPISIMYFPSEKKIIKIVNILGQEIGPFYKGIAFEIYEDGSSKRIIR